LADRFLALRFCFCFMTRGLQRHESIMYPQMPSKIRFAAPTRRTVCALTSVLWAERD
jgi:hypothetical protein